MFVDAAQVSNVIADVLSSSSIRLRWDSKQLADDIMGYIVFYKPTQTPSSVEITLTADKTENSILITNLKPEVEYQFEVALQTKLNAPFQVGPRSKLHTAVTSSKYTAVSTQQCVTQRVEKMY